jgi:hypothetical protein
MGFRVSTHFALIDIEYHELTTPEIGVDRAAYITIYVSDRYLITLSQVLFDCLLHPLSFGQIDFLSFAFQLVYAKSNTT